MSRTIGLWITELRLGYLTNTRGFQVVSKTAYSLLCRMPNFSSTEKVVSNNCVVVLESIWDSEETKLRKLKTLFPLASEYEMFPVLIIIIVVK